MLLHFGVPRDFSRAWFNNANFAIRRNIKSVIEPDFTGTSRLIGIRSEKSGSISSAESKLGSAKIIFEVILLRNVSFQRALVDTSFEHLMFINNHYSLCHRHNPIPVFTKAAVHS